MSRYLLISLTIAACINSSADVNKGNAPDVPSIKQDGAFQTNQWIGPSGAYTSPQKHWQEVIENHGSSAIIAFNAPFRCPTPGGGWVEARSLHDSLAHYGSDSPIPPGGSRQIDAADPKSCPGGVDALVFADGHSEGDPQQVKNIFDQRLGIYKEIDEMIKMLQTVGTGKKSPQWTIGALMDRATMISNGGLGGNSFEQRGRYVADTTARLSLQVEHGWHTPSDDTTETRQPSVEKVMETDHLSRTQANALVVTRKFEEWKAVLAGHTEPPHGQ
jgi:hypothetical protein